MEKFGAWMLYSFLAFMLIVFAAIVAVAIGTLFMLTVSGDTTAAIVLLMIGAAMVLGALFTARTGGKIT